MENVVNLDVQASNWYKNLKKIANKYLNIEVVEGIVGSGEPFKKHTHPQRLINVVTINKKLDIYDRLHWLLGLLLSVYCKQYKVGKLHINDLNYVTSIMWYKYGGDSDLAKETPYNNELVNKVLTQFETWLEEV